MSDVLLNAYRRLPASLVIFKHKSPSEFRTELVTKGETLSFVLYNAAGFETNK
jgi:hypothetical protein